MFNYQGGIIWLPRLQKEEKIQDQRKRRERKRKAAMQKYRTCGGNYDTCYIDSVHSACFE